MGKSKAKGTKMANGQAFREKQVQATAAKKEERKEGMKKRKRSKLGLDDKIKLLESPNECIVKKDTKKDKSTPEPVAAEEDASSSASSSGESEFKDEKWTCPLCEVSMSVGENGRNKQQHLDGKKHQKKERQLEAEITGTDTPQKKKVTKGNTFECIVCKCTLAGSAQADHEAGEKHLSKVAAVIELYRNGDIKKGDWICTKGYHKGDFQKNYASKEKCHRTSCKGTREEGCSYFTAKDLALKANVVVKGAEDMTLTCKSCKGNFTFGVEEQRTFEERGHLLPNNCALCRKKKKAVKTSTEDVQIDCRDCEAKFAFTVREQKMYEEKCYPPPTRCGVCRKKKKEAVLAKKLQVVPGTEDIELKCRDCSEAFTFDIKEQKKYAEKEWQKPSRCGTCRASKRQKLEAVQSLHPDGTAKK